MTTEAQRNADLVRRLKSAEGHLRGIQRLVGEGSPCLDLARQVVAVQRALGKVNGLVLDRHLRCCVTEGVWNGSGAAQDQALEELVRLVEAIGTT